MKIRNATARQILSRGSLMVVLTMSFCACGDSTRQSVQPVARLRGDSPKDALERLYYAGISGDKTQYASCFVGEGELIEVSTLTLEFCQTAYRLQDTVIAVFGESAWDELLNGDKKNVLYFQVFDRNSNPFVNIEIEQNGDQATFQWPLDNSGNTLAKMVRREGRWYVEVESLFVKSNDENGADPERILRYREMFPRFARGMDDLRGGLGKPGMTISSLRKELCLLFCGFYSPTSKTP